MTQSTPFFPFVRIVMPTGGTLYYMRGDGFRTAPSPYPSGGPFVLQNLVSGYPVMDNPFSGVATGSCVLEGGAVDTGMNHLGEVDRETLTVQ